MDKKEKLYKTVANSAIWNLVMGIVVLVTGITSGVLLLISAVRLMRSKGDMRKWKKSWSQQD